MFTRRRSAKSGGQLSDLVEERCEAFLPLRCPDVNQRVHVHVRVAGMTEEKARAEVDRMCRDLLANTVIENYSYELAP